MHTYNIKNTYKNKTRINYGKNDEPLFEHEIIETYSNVVEEHVEAVIANMLDVKVGVDTPEFINPSAKDNTINIPDDLKNDIVKDYRERYTLMSGLMTELKTDMFGDGKLVEKTVDLSNGEKYDSDNSKTISSCIKIIKNV